jgi:hypothetical protein
VHIVQGSPAYCAGAGAYYAGVGGPIVQGLGGAYYAGVH